MKVPRAPHRWVVSPRRAMAIQEYMAGCVDTRRTRARLRLVAGADIAFSRDGARAISGVVVWDVSAREVVETASAAVDVAFPYVPGLLTFREGRAVLAAARRLKSEPDAFLFDGQGIAHPRRCGLASHLGLLLGKPSAGCGKSRLIGTFSEPGPRRGARRWLWDGGERIGAVVRTRDDVKCVFVSVGSGMSLAQAVELVLACGAGYRVPEPTRLADQLVSRIKRRYGLIAKGRAV